ncbi:phytoene dehydrogenase-like protein [Pseudoclavibacter sp. JAI123]|uniref:phytoene desaturase family protein n=1 Tax=Pseudoclavibacter sp. JAI123 TaxID=2723065 RepID=UPI0015C6E86E|nr:NAD(P)/FAD-dependent oxidoreductase [Pseudoclavibacter sp. JAI123]NYF13890.1 phytoene dehydrogenase-like protein [Pseudoclavibacter sp. JAI123]
MNSHVVVIGGGHNGLVAANYLARAGSQVTLIEARQQLGGVVGRIEYMPGYSASITNSPGSLEGRIIQELELDRFGLRFHFPEITLLHPMDDGLFVGWRDRARVAAQLDAFSEGEAERHRALIERLDRVGASTRLSVWDAPGTLEDVVAAMDASSRVEFLEIGVEGSLSQLLDESLKSDAAKSLMMMLALNGQLVSPRSPGSAFGLLMRPISRASSAQDVLGIGDSPLRGSVGLPLGSMGSIVDALALAARANGVNIRAGSAVTNIELDADEHVSAVVLDTGERLTGFDAAVVTLEPSRLRALLPSATLDESCWPKPPLGSAFKIGLALDGLPGLADAPPGVPIETLLEAQFRIGPSSSYITKAVDDGLAGKASDAPIIWGLIPSLGSPGLAPDGKHLLSLNVWHAPHSLGHDHWREHGDEFVDRCLRELEPRLPGLTDRVTDAHWFSPHDLEREYNLTGSNITHGDMLPTQMLGERPGAELSAELLNHGIVLGGAGTWPGGYVTGIPGRNAAVLAHSIRKRTKVGTR